MISIQTSCLASVYNADIFKQLGFSYSQTGKTYLHKLKIIMLQSAWQLRGRALVFSHAFPGLFAQQYSMKASYLTALPIVYALL